MGWAFDDAPDPFTPAEHAARERAATRFRAAAERAMARAQARSRARGEPIQNFISDSALYSATGLPEGGLPLAELRAWKQKLEEGTPVTRHEADSVACMIGNVLGVVALEALRAIELGTVPPAARCDLGLLTLAEDMTGRHFKSPGARTLFEFAAALMEEVAWLGVRIHTWNGVSHEDTTSRFVALAQTLGM